MSRRLVLWRHGRTEWNAIGRFQGQTDIDLDPVGRDQAASAAPYLASLEPDLIVSSDLRRAVDTAAILHALVGGQPRQDVRLRETFAGAWQGLTGAEIAEQHPEDFRVWRDGDPHIRVGGGESRVEVATRISAACEDVVAELPEDGLAVVVTHGGAARLAVGALIGLPIERFTRVGGLANCAWSVLRQADDLHGRGWTLVEHNAGSLPLPVPLEEG